MPGIMIAAGQVPTLPDVYFMLNANDVLTPVEGVVLALIRADDGPLNAFQRVFGVNQLKDLYGTAGGVEVAAEALRGQASELLVYRVGTTGGVKATKTLVDTTGSPIDAVRLDAKAVGIRGNTLAYTLGDSLLSPTTLRELVLYRQNTAGQYLELQRFTFAKGSSGIGEPQALVNALANDASQFVDAAKLADGTKILATVSSPTLFTTGANPTVNGAAFTAALTAAETEAWNVMVLDSEDTTIQTSAVAAAKTWEGKGLYRFLALGDPVSVTASLATRASRAAVFNAWNVAYVIDQFTNADAATVEGAEAAGRVAGMMAAAGYRDSLSGAVLDGATGLPAPLGIDDLKLATANGAIVFRSNPRRQPAIVSGVTTYVTGDGIHTQALWKHILVTRRFYTYLENVAARWADQVGKVENTPNGRAALVGSAQGELNDLIAAEIFQGGTVAVAASPPSAGDLAYIALNPMVSNKIERLVGVVSFQ